MTEVVGFVSLRRLLLHPLVKTILILAATYLLAWPQVGWALRVLGTLDDHSVVLPVFASLLAVGAVVAYAQVTRLLFDTGERPGLWVMLGVVVTALGVNRVVPAGSVSGGIVTFRLLGRIGIGRARAGFVMTAQGLGSNVLLVVLVAGAMLVALPVYGLRPVYVGAASAGVVVLVVAAVVADALWSSRRWARAVARLLGAGMSRRWPTLGPDRMVAGLAELAQQFRLLWGRRRAMRSVAVWSVANWLLDAASLWVFLEFFGAAITPAAVILAFGAANLVGMVPLTPGGLGVVDVTMTLVLSQFGVPADAAALGVAGYRLSHYWLPIPAAAIAYLMVRTHLARRPVGSLEAA